MEPLVVLAVFIGWTILFDSYMTELSNDINRLTRTIKELHKEEKNDKP